MNQLRLLLTLIVLVLGVVSSYGQAGCTIPTACNYDPMAVVNDGSCLWTIDCAGNCGGNFVLDDCQNCYDPTVQGYVELNYAGNVIQQFVIPAGVFQVTFEAFGAQGGGGINNNIAGGRGARMKGTFAVTPGETFDILVGRMGGTGSSVYDPCLLYTSDAADE